MKILALHGFLGRGLDFQPLMQALANGPASQRQLQFVTPSLFDPLSEAQFPQDFSDWQKRKGPALLRESSARVLIGYSFGGRLALELFFSNPDAIDLVIVLGSNLGLLSSAEKKERIASDQAWAEQLSTLSWEEFNHHWNSQAIFKNEAQATPPRYSGDYSVASLQRALTHFSLGHMQTSPSALKRYKEKLYFFSGERDPKITPLYAELAQQGVIANWQVLPAAGHRLLHENPSSLADRLVRILNLV